MADSKVSALAELSVPDFSDDIYIVNDTGPTSNKLGTDRLFGLGGFTPGGRLTLETAVPVSSTDQLAKTSLYYTPYLHNLVRLWDGTRWILRTFSEVSLALTLTSGKNYDVFLDDDGVTLVLSAAWTNDTTRADALGTQDSVQVLNSDKTKLWLGTIRASTTNQCEDSLAKRFVYNYYNRVLRRGYNASSTGHTYNSATYRAWNNVATRAEFVLGVAETVNVALNGNIACAINGFPVVLAMLDWTSGGAAAGDAFFAINQATVETFLGGSVAYKSVGLGYHYFQLVEAALAATIDTFDNASVAIAVNI